MKDLETLLFFLHFLRYQVVSWCHWDETYPIFFSLLDENRFFFFHTRHLQLVCCRLKYIQTEFHCYYKKELLLADKRIAAKDKLSRFQINRLWSLREFYRMTGRGRTYTALLFKRLQTHCFSRYVFRLAIFSQQYTIKHKTNREIIPENSNSQVPKSRRQLTEIWKVKKLV